jgi:hypothetical protein
VLVVAVIGAAGCSAPARPAHPASPLTRPRSSPVVVAQRNRAPAAEVPPRHVNAGPDKGYLAHAYGRQLPRGTVVPVAAVLEHSNAGGQLVGLADSGPFLGESYPVISRDAGSSWTVAGPKLWLAAAQGAAAVDYIGGSGTTWFAWGMSIVTTFDGGKRWWRSFLGDAIRQVHVTSQGTLIAVAITDQPAPGHAKPPKYISWRYRSVDGGRQWTYLGKGLPVHSWPVGSNGKQRPPSG